MVADLRTALREVEAEYGLLAALSVPGLGRSDG